MPRTPAHTAIPDAAHDRRTRFVRGGPWSGWAQRRRLSEAARFLWDALCQLEVTLKRPLPDPARQARAVAEARAEVESVWNHYGFSLTRHLDAADRAIVQRAVAAPRDGSNAVWENELVLARDALAGYIR